MKFSTLLKGATFAVALFALANEASAQVPVRTRQLQLLGSTSGVLTQQANATTTSYTITWPAAATAAADSAILITTGAGNLEWFDLPSGDAIITGSGNNGEVAYFDGNSTITSSPTMTFNGTTGTLTLGNGTNDGSLVLVSSGTGNPNVTINAIADNAQTWQYPDQGSSVGPFNFVGTTNSPTANQIPIAQADGTVIWADNPSAFFKAGSVTPAANAFTATVTFTTAYSAVPIVTAVVNAPTANGNLVQVTSVTVNGFTINSTAPFDGTDTIHWMANLPSNP